MRRILLLPALVACGAALLPSSAKAEKVYYQPRSFYMLPPMYSNISVFGPQPIIVYEPVVTYPAPIAGYYGTIPSPSAPVTAPAPVAPAPIAPGAAVAPVPPVRVRERQISTPFHTRYKYQSNYPGGLEYKYRYKRDFGRVRFSEKLD